MIAPKARLGYFYGLNVEERPWESPGKSGGEDFFFGKAKKQRMAGDILNIDLSKSPGTPSTLPLPKLLDVQKSTGIPERSPLDFIGNAELRL
jgi:hypothetical protein